jgi:hypothetical protein
MRDPMCSERTTAAWRQVPWKTRGGLAVAAVLILSLGLNWMSIQCIAWGYMVLKYSQNASWSNAINKTFDGQHPCQLCKIAQESKKSERGCQIPQTKQDLLTMSVSRWLFDPPYRFLAYSSSSSWGAPRILAPPKPPPRAA